MPKYSELEQQAIDEAIRKLLAMPRYRIVYWRLWLSAVIAGVAAFVIRFLPIDALRIACIFLVGFAAGLVVRPWRPE